MVEMELNCWLVMCNILHSIYRLSVYSSGMYHVCISSHHLLHTCDNLAIVTVMHFNPAADCGAPPPPVHESLLQPHTNTTEGSVVVFQCDPGFVPEGVMTTVCGRDGQWSPNPGGLTCSPGPTQTFTQSSNQAEPGEIVNCT